MKSCRYCRKFGNSFFCYTRKKNYLFENRPILYSSGSWQFSTFLLLSGLLLSWILLKLPHRLIYFLILFQFGMGLCFLQWWIFVVNDISDHLPIFAIILGHKHAFSGRNRYFNFRLKNQQNMPRFKSELENVNWTELPDYNDPYVAYRSFLEKPTAIFNQCFPLGMARAKGYTTSNSGFLKHF